MLTADSITDEQIRELRAIARAAADSDGTVHLDAGYTIFSGEVIDICQLALGFRIPSAILTRENARARCAAIINARNRPHCASCVHPHHPNSICTGRMGGTAWQCGCTCSDARSVKP